MILYYMTYLHIGVLYVIFQLYEEFADRFDLCECKLAIVHCAGLADMALVESLWQSLIDKGGFTLQNKNTTKILLKC